MKYKPTESQVIRMTNLINNIAKDLSEMILFDDDLEHIISKVVDKHKFQSFLFDRVLTELENSEDVLYIFSNSDNLENIYNKALRDGLIKEI